MTLRRWILYALILAVVLAGLYFLTRTGSAFAVTVTNADEQTEQAIHDALAYGWVPLDLIDALSGGVSVTMEEGLTERKGSVGWATSDGRIRIDPDLHIDNPCFVGIVRHEWCHQLWWCMDAYWHARWIWMCSQGKYDYTNWRLNPKENFCECMRTALWSDYSWKPRTSLTMISEGDCKVFVRMWQRSLLPIDTPH